MHSFTANVPTNQIRVFNPYDELNPALVRTKPTASGAVSGKGATIEAGIFFTQYAPTSLSSGDTAANGYTGDYGNSGFNAIVGPGTETIWSLEAIHDSPRHFLFGDFTFKLDGFLVNVPSGAGECALNAVVWYADGTAIFVAGPIFVQTQSADYRAQDTFSFTTDGLGDFQDKSGIPVANIELQLANNLNAPATAQVMSGITVQWHDVPSTSTYLATVITGAQVGAQINVEMSAHTEIRPDPSTRIAQYVTPTNDLPYDPTIYPTVLLALEHLRFQFVDYNVQAGSFGKNLKTVFRKTARVAAPMLANVASTAADAYLPGSGALLRSAYQAGSFSAGKTTTGLTGFSFPAVKVDTPLTASVAQIDVINKAGPSPSFVKDITARPLTASFKDYQGDSADLAFLLAALTKLGFPTRKGMYSGHVTEVYANDKVASFCIQPVDLTHEKAAAFPERLSALTPDGWYHRGKVQPLNGAHLFGPVENSTTEIVDALPGLPGKARRVIVTRK